MRNPPPNNRQCLAGQRGGGFPAHAKRPAPNRAGHLRVRYAERYNALDLAPRWGCKVVRPGTPRHPGLRFRSCLKGRALPPFLPPCGAAETRPRGGTRDEGRGDALRKISIKIAPAISCRRCYCEIYWFILCAAIKLQSPTPAPSNPPLHSRVFWTMRAEWRLAHG